jgi:hypothetical protein
MWHQLGSATIEAIPTLVVALVTLVLGWLLGNRIAARWEEVKKRRALELEALGKFYQLYGEFYSIWKLWTVHKAQSKYLIGYQRDPDKVWQLLERAAEVEGGFESLLVRLTQERTLKPDDIDQLSRFREAYQCLRESIRADRNLDWKANPSRGASALKYQAFKRLASRLASLLSQPDHGSTLWHTPRSPSPSNAATALLGATSVGYRGTWWISGSEVGTPLAASTQGREASE